MGTAIGTGGLIVTKASQTNSSPEVRLCTGRVVPAQVVGVNPAYDVALLKVEGLECPKLSWSSQRNPAAGTLLMSPSNTGVPIAAGIVSVPRRNIAGPYPDQVVTARVPDEKTALGDEAFRGRPPSVDSILGIRRNGFPVMVECDLPMTADERGGPVLGLDDSVLGIVIARIGAYGSAVIPSDVIQELLPQLLVGKPLNRLPDRTRK
jgi:S1-C subfamily serine protease